MAKMKKTIKEKVLALIPKLSEYEFKEVAQFVELSHINFHLENLQKEAKEARYSEGQYICPFCHGTHVVKNGTKKGLQRYLCRRCRKSFSDQTATPSCHSKNHLRYGFSILNVCYRDIRFVNVLRNVR